MSPIDISTKLDSVVRSVGTPCYIYNYSIIRENIARFAKIPYPHKAIHFATMANNNRSLLRMLKNAKFGVFVNSMKHLALALECGFTPCDVVYAASALDLADMKTLLHKGVRFHLDSVSQLDQYGALAPRSSCGVRLNIGERSPSNTLAAPQRRIGITREEIPTLLSVASRHSLRISGVHAYLGTNLESPRALLDGARMTLGMADHFPDLAYVDLGGGFPVSDTVEGTFDYQAYGEGITALFEAYSARRRRRIKLILEPGRAIFGDAAVFCTRIPDLKEREETIFACCDASVSLLPRPLFYGAYHVPYVLGKEGMPVVAKSVDIVGSTTYSRDYLARAERLPELDIGDVVVFRNTGSYCYSMMSHFLGQHWPAEILLCAAGDFKIIRDRI